MKRFFHLRYLFWLLVPLLLWWALRDVSLVEIGAVLRHLTSYQILALLAANVVVLLLFSARWWIISRAQGYSIPYFTLAGYRLAAFGVSYFTPGPQFGGEPLQVYLTERKHNVPRATAIAAVSLDKTLEVLFNFTFLAFGLMTILQWQIFPQKLGQQAMAVAVALLVLVVGLLLAVFSGRHPVSNLWKITVRWLPDPNVDLSSRYDNIYQTIRDSESQIAQFFRHHPLAMGLALGVSAITLLAMIGEFWLATYVLGLELNFVQGISLLTAARIAFLLPAPGGLGTLEASQVFAFTALGLNPAVGLSLTLLIRIRDIALAASGLLWGGITLQSNKELNRVSIKT
jgi:uncharacterized protein (TIRG00374 family)